MFYKLIIKSQKLIRLEHLLFTDFDISKYERFLLKKLIRTGRSGAVTLGIKSKDMQRVGYSSRSN
jgi:hypothetical protein